VNKNSLQNGPYPYAVGISSPAAGMTADTRLGPFADGAFSLNIRGARYGRALKINGHEFPFEVAQIESVVFFLLNSALHEGFGIMNPDTAGSDNTDGFQVLGPKHGTEPTLTSCAACIVNQAGNTA